MTTKHQLDTLLPPAEQQAMVNRAIAADSLRRAAHDAWLDPHRGSLDRLSATTKYARSVGVSERDLDQLEDQGIREAIRAHQKH